MNIAVIPRSYPNMAAPNKQPMQLINGTYYVNTEAAAQLCGVSKTTVIAWRKQPNAPTYDNDLKMYPLPELGDWMRGEQIYKRGKGGAFTWKPDMSRFPSSAQLLPSPVTILPGMEKPEVNHDEDAETRVKRLRGDKLQMEIQERAGELVDADEMLIVLSSMISRVKTRILSLPTALAATVTGNTDRVQVQSMIEEKIHATLEELSTNPMQDLENKNGL